MSFTPPFTRTKRLARKIVRGPKLPLALTIAIFLSLILTVVSVTWYSVGGSSKLDLSRPGYEHERTEVRATETQKTYDTTSAVTKSAIDDFLHEYDERAKELNGLGSFTNGALDDNNIQVTTQTGSQAQ